MTVPSESLGLLVEADHTLMDLVEACIIFYTVTIFAARQYIHADRT